VAKGTNLIANRALSEAELAFAVGLKPLAHSEPGPIQSELVETLDLGVRSGVTSCHAVFLPSSAEGLGRPQLGFLVSGREDAMRAEVQPFDPTGVYLVVRHRERAVGALPLGGQRPVPSMRHRMEGLQRDRLEFEPVVVDDALSLLDRRGIRRTFS
jgi:hypothetical protein